MVPGDDRPFPVAVPDLPSRDSLRGALARIIADSEHLRLLAQRQHLAMLDYLLGMVVLEAQQLRRQVTDD